MLYLIQSSDFLKIGYTSNLEQRIKKYKTHNPDFKIIATRKGNKKDEIYLHRLLHKYRVDKTEWFSYSTFIIKVFREYAPYKLDQEYAKNLITPKHINKLLESNDKKRLDRLKDLISLKKLAWRQDGCLFWI